MNSIGFEIVASEIYDGANVPDDGVLEEVVQDWARDGAPHQDTWISKGENDFLIWRDDGDAEVVYVNAWFSPGFDGDRRELTAYYELRTEKEVSHV